MRLPANVAVGEEAADCEALPLALPLALLLALLLVLLLPLLLAAALPGLELVPGHSR